MLIFPLTLVPLYSTPSAAFWIIFNAKCWQSRQKWRFCSFEGFGLFWVRSPFQELVYSLIVPLRRLRYSITEHVWPYELCCWWNYSPTYSMLVVFNTSIQKRKNSIRKLWRLWRISTYCTVRPAMSNPNGLLSQNLCHYLNQGHTFNDIVMRPAHWMAYFDLIKLNLASANVLKAFES